MNFDGIVIGGGNIWRGRQGLSVERTKSDGMGMLATLINSITEKILPLADDLIIYPGHGGETTVGFEKKHNPYLS